MSGSFGQGIAGKAATEKQDRRNDDAYKSRIIKHMNADHQDSVSRYLQYYHHFSPFRARNAQLEDVSLGSMTITAGRQRKVISLDPEMKSYQEARGRLIEIDQHARAALSLGEITIDEYAAPRGFGLFMVVFCIVYSMCFYTRANFEPGSLLYEWYAPKFPWLVEFLHKTQPIFYPALLTHIGETIYFARTRLRVYGVGWWTLLWWQYVVTQFVEGWTSVMRFDDLVSKKVAKKAAEKH